ncbi:hypothetical protein [Longibacter sp.]|uniref:hypothetical protein n=1 Tax=Longibacter sp. TaxID=2045415 RepID=UPI003EB6F53C
MRRLLWVDCIGAAVAGVTVIAVSGWLSRLEGLPQEVLLFTGTVNLLYGAFSFSLAVRAERPLALIRLLVAANLTWAFVCLGLLGLFVENATPIAFVHFVGEAVYVGGLAILEWRNRDLLRHAGQRARRTRPADR